MLDMYTYIIYTCIHIFDVYISLVHTYVWCIRVNPNDQRKYPNLRQNVLRMASLWTSLMIMGQ